MRVGGWFMAKAAILAVLSAALVPGAASATVGYEPAEFLDQTGTLESRPAVAVRSDGTRLVAFANGSADVMLRTIAPDGSLGALQELSDPSTSSGYPDIVVDSADRATVVWYARTSGVSRVESRRVASDGTLGALQVLSPSGASNNSYEPQVEVDAAGVATVAWNNNFGPGNPGKIEAVRLAADNTGAPLGQVMTIDDPNTPGNPIEVNAVDTAIDSTGRVTLAWERYDGGTPAIKTARIAADGTVGPVRNVSSTPGATQQRPEVAIDPTGQATIAWASFESPARAMYSQLDAATATPSAPVAISDTTRNTQDWPQLVASPDGSETVVWTATPPAGGGAQTEARRITADGNLGTSLVLGPSEFLPRERLVAEGDALSRVTVGFQATDGRLLTRRISADGALSTTQRMLFDTGQLGEGFDIAFDSANRASVVWSENGVGRIRRALTAPAAPDTRFIDRPPAGVPVEDLTPQFRFESDVVEATVECRVDAGDWEACESPGTFRLDPGQHTIEVRSTDADGTDATPDSVSFEVSAAGCDKATADVASAEKKLKAAKRKLAKAKKKGSKRKVKKAKRAVAEAKAALALAGDAVSELC